MVLQQVGWLISWVGEGGSSYHLPIMIQLGKEECKSLGPFKFKHHWLVEEGFENLIL